MDVVKKKMPIGIKKDVGLRIRKIRGSLNQKEFAKILEVNQATICKYEAGRIPEALTLNKIADHGGVTVEWLLHGKAPPVQAKQLRELALEIYDAWPRELNLNYLTQALLIARKFCWAARPRLPARSEAELAAYLYEYWQETGLQPDQVVVKRYAALIKIQED